MKLINKYQTKVKIYLKNPLLISNAIFLPYFYWTSALFFILIIFCEKEVNSSISNNGNNGCKLFAHFINLVFYTSGGNQIPEYSTMN